MRRNHQEFMDLKQGGRSMHEYTKAFIDVSYAALQAYGIVNVALHQEYSPGVIFILSQGRKYLYYVSD
jgi:hypothetical protein